MPRGGYRRRHMMPKVSPADVAEIRRRRRDGLYKTIARDFGISVQTARRVITGLGPYKFDPAEFQQPTRGEK